MNSNISRILTATLFVICLSLFVSSSSSSLVSAQEGLHAGGGVAGGRQNSTPIQLKVGEMVEGEIVLHTDRLRLSVADYTGEIIHDFGYCSTRCGFYYAAATDGQHYLVATNPDAFSVGERWYDINYSIKATDIAPGTGSGKEYSGDVTPNPWPTIWLITGIIVFLGLVLLVARSRREEIHDIIVYRVYRRRRR